MIHTMIIRPYKSTDRVACINIFKSNCPVYFDPTEIDGLENWLNGQDKEEITYNTSAADFFYVMEHEGSVVGCGGFYMVEDKPHANMVWGMVERKYHKQGLGKKLFLHRMEEIRKRFSEYAIVLDTTQHTYRFFEKLGFTVISIAPDAYGPGLDRYDMIRQEKTLTPEIKTIPETKLIGMRMNMSLADNKTFELWRSFMPRRREIINKVNPTDMFSMQVYPLSYNFSNIDLNAMFEKRAVAEVTDFDTIPEGMESFVLPEGLYAVFHYKGAASNGPQVFGYIFGTWLPASGYAIDNRPHFEILGEKYKHDSPDSEEEIWIPVKENA